MKDKIYTTEEVVTSLGSNLLSIIKNLKNAENNAATYVVWFQGEKFSIAVLKGEDIMITPEEESNLN